MHFDLTDLRLLVWVVDTGSITAGAEKACLSLSSASARIAGLEQEAGVGLLDRRHRGVTVTPAGRVMYDHAKIILRQTAHLSGELSEFTQGIKGHVRLLANTVALGQFLPGPLCDFLRLHPGVDIDLDEMPSLDITRAVAQGAADIGIAADHADFRGLEVLPFRADRLVLATPREHVLGQRRQVSFSEALDHEFIGLPEDSALARYIAGQASRTGKTMRIRARVRGLDNIHRMVAGGAGVAVLPIVMSVTGPDNSGVAFIPLDETWTRRQLMMVVRSRGDLPPAAKRLVDFLTATRPQAVALAAGKYRRQNPTDNVR
ncbi:LysR family transcriptional regulator [Acerihabitans arboris]|uniref:LysR family transcriptional regulator n=1 Tax=Acerihabitans arboris TaxID=2691583 RepID=A0A845SFI5_9GAMM|nr:LysR family transcriptional regulator [Acerihabitans arboris]NDL63783.1 LysR family transcriptional regulator [Acerihabitans arboris]